MKLDIKNCIILFFIYVGFAIPEENTFALDISQINKQKKYIQTSYAVRKNIAKESGLKLAINEDSIETELNDENSKQKIKQDKTNTQSQEESLDINKNLVTPNESPGIFSDPQRTKRYYDSVEDSRRTRIKKDTSKQKIIEEEIIQLPARIQKEGDEVYIEKIEFAPKSEIFSDSEIAQFKALAEGHSLTAEDLDNLIGIINQQYIKKGVITAKAFLNSGALKAGILTIELMEAKVGDVIVKGNRFNRKWFLRSRISNKTGNVLNLQTMENDLRLFNKNARSVQLSARLKPGKNYGTTDVILEAKESFPFHLSTSWDSFGRETTGLLRSGIMASADSLLGFQDRLTGAINLSRGSKSPFIDYNIPLNKKGTRAGVSYIYGDNKIKSGRYKDFDLGTNTHVLSTYISHPLIDNEKGSLNLNLSGNFKFSKADIFNYTYSNYKDYNVAIGIGGHRNFKKSMLYGSFYSTNGIIDDHVRHDSRYFTKLNADGYYVYYLPKNIIATLKAGGQYSPQDMAYIEQYQIGGISTVRGYSESLLLAPASYFVSAEMLFPVPFLPEVIKVPFTKGEKQYRLKDSIKFAVFYDHGAIFPHHGKVEKTNFLMSVGAGIRLAISKYLTARIYVGVPLTNTSAYQEPNARVHFDIIMSPF